MSSMGMICWEGPYKWDGDKNKGVQMVNKHSACGPTKTYVLMMKPRKDLDLPQRPLTIRSVFERLYFFDCHLLLHK